VAARTSQEVRINRTVFGLNRIGGPIG
jgi:hypothetical protein